MQMRILGLLCLPFFLQAAAEQQIPMASVQALGTVRKQRIALIYKDGLFFVKRGDEQVQVKECFVDKELRNISDEKLKQLLAKGLILKVGITPDSGYSIGVGAKGKGGGLLRAAVYVGGAIVCVYIVGQVAFLVGDLIDMWRGPKRGPLHHLDHRQKSKLFMEFQEQYKKKCPELFTVLRVAQVKERLDRSEVLNKEFKKWYANGKKIVESDAEEGKDV